MNKLREALAALEHEQWMKWAQNLMDSENLSHDRVKRWNRYMIPYEELDERTKDHDRWWADLVISVLLENGVLPY